jgi:hypothetical protein
MREIVDVADHRAQSVLNWFRSKPRDLKDVPRDSWKDLWNNAIGRQIGEYVRKNNLSQNDLERLLMQAYRRGDLIRSDKDPRVPANASGWPGDFPPAGTRGAPVWAGPDSGWQPEPGEGIARGAIPPI